MKFAIATVAFMATSGVLSAGSLFSPTGGTGPFQNGLYGGPGFHTDNTITVTALGAYTFGPTHLNNSSVFLGQIGTPNLLASGVVVDGASRESDGYAYYTLPVPVVLAPGDYLVTAQTFTCCGVGEGRLEVYNVNPATGVGSNGSLNPGAGITFLGTWYWNGSGTISSTPSYDTMFWGLGGLKFDTGGSPSVPEPATWTLFGGAFALVFARKLRKNTAV